MDNIPSNEQIKEVKSKGFLHNRGTDCFSARIITENGVLSSQQMTVLSEAAERFGNSTMAFTVRMTVEIPNICYADIPEFTDFIEKNGMKTGGTGHRIRPIVACKGTTCVFGLCDTQALASKIHKQFFERDDLLLPHKFKITVGGCPNNCAKPDLNDIGIVGQRMPNFDFDACRGCKKCGVEAACPMKAAKVVDGKLSVDPSLCNNCGRCVGNCWFKINQNYIDMYKLYIGGRWGKKIRLGSQLNRLFTGDELFDTIERTIMLFKDEGINGERFGETIDRIGLDIVQDKLLKDS